MRPFSLIEGRRGVGEMKEDEEEEKKKEKKKERKKL
jgi:hypothetical protein